MSFIDDICWRINERAKEAAFRLEASVGQYPSGRDTFWKVCGLISEFPDLKALAARGDIYDFDAGLDVLRNGPLAYHFRSLTFYEQQHLMAVVGQGVKPQTRRPAKPSVWLFDVYTDGSFRPKTKRMGAGWVIVGGDGEQYCEGSYPVEIPWIADSYAPEIMAVVYALNAVPDDSDVTVLTDSLMVVECMTKSRAWGVHGILLEILKKQHRRLGMVTYQHVPGHATLMYNERADQLAVSASTGKKKGA
jgi:ribonuclease HI